MHVKALSPLIPRNSLHMQNARDAQSKSASSSNATSDRKRSIAQRENVAPAQLASELRSDFSPSAGASNSSQPSAHPPLSAQWGLQSPPRTAGYMTPEGLNRTTSGGWDRSANATQPPEIRGTTAMLTAATLAAAPVLDRYQVVKDLSAGGRSKVNPLPLLF